MTDAVFSVASLAAMAAWLGLAASAVVRAGTLRDRLLFISGRVIPFALCVAYAVVLFIFWGSAPGGGFSSLTAVIALFSVPGKMLGGWLHFLAFDLLVGRWMVDHALSGGRSRLPLLAALPTTFLYGPIGVLLYTSAQAWTSRGRTVQP